jgi:neutral ceramidase
VMVGGGGQPRAEHIHDELHARCLVLDDGETRLVFVVCDNVGIVREVFDMAKRMAQSETGIPASHMLMSSTHTHSGPSARRRSALVMGGSLDDYQQFLARRIADGIRRAINNLEPARIGWGSGEEPNQVFNRRWHMKPGTPLPNPFGGEDKVRMNPGVGNPNLLEPAGPVDPEIYFISVQATDGRPIALLANYSLHYVGGTGRNHISADYFGMFAERIGRMIDADRVDPPFVGIMTNGTSGDVNNINFAGERKRLPPYAKMRQVANAVAAEVYRVYQTIEYHDWVPLAAEETELALGARVPTDEQVAWAREVLARPEGTPQTHVREETYARRVLQMADWPEQIPVLLQTFRLGELGVAAIPFEVFAETGLEIKERSPFPSTFTISLANGAYGYLPTARQHELGGYETWLGTSRVEVDAASKIVDSLLEMFAELESR